MAFKNMLQTYAAPEWVRKSLSNLPRCRLQLANLDTPIHKWALPGVPEGFDVYIKRDDMTGCTLSGNKVRKLEFLLADAVKRGCRHVITCGGIQSNHCRATTVAAAQIGLKTHLVLRTETQDTEDVGSRGNVLLNRLCGAAMYLVPRNVSYKSGLQPRMERLAQHIKEETGEDSYLIPVGGSNALGVYGYLEGFNELITQGATEEFDDIVFACGSGGTADGLALGNHLTSRKLGIHGVAVSDNADYFYAHTTQLLEQLHLEDVNATDIVDIIDGYKGRGYGLSTPEELEFIREVAQKTGIILDPVYTGKAVRGMLEELAKNPTRFRGRRILFLHTGGAFGTFDGRLDKMLCTPGLPSNQCHVWTELDSPPF